MLCLLAYTRRPGRQRGQLLAKEGEGCTGLNKRQKRGKEEEKVIYENEADEEKEEEEVHKRQAYTRARYSCRQVQLSLAFTSLVAI